MTNPLKNTVTIHICGKDREMRAGWTTMSNVEFALKVHWSQLGDIIVGGTYGFNQVATIIDEALRGNKDDRLTREQIGEDLVEQGLAKFLPPVIELIGMGFKGTKLVAQGPKSDESLEA